MSFSRVGIAGDMGIFASLPARAGIAAARQLMMLPRGVTGQKHWTWGWPTLSPSPAGRWPAPWPTPVSGSHRRRARGLRDTAAGTRPSRAPVVRPGRDSYSNAD